MSLFLPNWSIDRRRPNTQPDKPTVIADWTGGSGVVAAADPGVAAGITPGMPLADARAIDPDLAVLPADPAGDAAALQHLAQWCGRYCPWTAPDGGTENGSAGIWLDITGAAHLQGGEANLAADLIARLARRGISARAAIADTPGAAWAVARSGAVTRSGAVARRGQENIVIVPPGEHRAALAALPVRALRLSWAAVELLERLGLRRIGDLYDLPRPSLVLRFGLDLARRLDQALGAAAEPLSPVPPEPIRWSHRHFAEPVASPEDLAAAARELLRVLCARLEKEELGARRLRLRFHRVDGILQSIEIGTASPSREPAHLALLMLERLDTIEPALGIEDMRLDALSVEKLGAHQIDLPEFDLAKKTQTEKTGQISAMRAIGALVDRLENRLGPGAVAALCPRDSHIPERAMRRVPVFTVAAGTQWNTEKLRPIRLLPHPEPIEAVAPVPDDPPLLFRWRRLIHRVRAADGPERILGEWWREPEASPEEDDRLRDYYCVEDEGGRRFWLFRAGLHHPPNLPRWFLHGLFA